MIYLIFCVIIFSYLVLFVYLKCKCLMQKLKTRVMKKNVNPEWNEDLTLSISDPNLPIKLVSSWFVAVGWCGIHLVKIGENIFQ